MVFSTRIYSLLVDGLNSSYIQFSNDDHHFECLSENESKFDEVLASIQDSRHTMILLLSFLHFLSVEMATPFSVKVFRSCRDKSICKQNVRRMDNFMLFIKISTHFSYTQTGDIIITLTEKVAVLKFVFGVVVFVCCC